MELKTHLRLGRLFLAQSPAERSARCRFCCLTPCDSPLHASWHVVRSDDKKGARLNTMAHLLSLIPYEELPRDKPQLPKRQKSHGCSEPNYPCQLIPFFAELPPCVVAMEACASAHHWGRALIELGHEVRLLPPAHVKPYVRRNKNDAVDAAAICEAAGRPGQRFVPVRSIDNQAHLMRHRTRELLTGQRTALLNALRGHLAEIGLVAPQGA